MSLPALLARAKAEVASRERMKAMKTDAEADFLSFVRMMWPVLEPERPLIEGWLLDLLCLPYEAEVITEDGPMAIGRYVEDGCRARVLSFDHSSAKPEWENVVARQKSQGKPLTKISLCDTMLSMTDDHPVFVKGRGYVGASEVRTGETVLRVRKLRGDVPPVAGAREERLLQPGLPLPTRVPFGQGQQATELRSVRNGFLPSDEENQILQSNVFRAKPEAASYQNMSDLRGTKELGRDPVPTLRHEIQRHRHRRLVRNLWENVVGHCREAVQILQSGLFRHWEQRRKQCRIYPRGMDEEISSRILANAGDNPQARWTSLLPVPRQEGTSHPSHRPRCGQQWVREFGHSLPYMSSDTARSFGEVYTVVESSVLAVERDIRIPETVYNLAVESNHNYFANGILVHNCDVLMAVTDGDMTRVCINVPPGSTKSTLLNVLWPAWEWGPCNRPGTRYISVSYSTDVPVRDNLRFVRVIKHPVYQSCWGDRVKLIRDGAEWVGNDRTGFKMVTSTSGGTTGFRGDRLLLDDLNNPISVESDTVRGTTNKFIREVMPDRLNDLKRSAIINLQQRTHRDDATGNLIEFGQGYEFVCVPMEFDPLRIGRVALRRDINGKPAEMWVDPRSMDEHGKQLKGLTRNARGELYVVMGSPMAQAEGESCWPERFDEEAVEKIKLEKGAYAWDSQYQQIPGVRGGAVIQRDWWKTWDSDDFPALGTVVVSVDTAVEEKETNDWNAVTAWGVFAGQQGEPLFLLLAAWKIRTNLANLVRLIAETCREKKADYLLIEHKTRGRDVSDEIQRLYATATWDTVLVKPEGDKLSRLKAVSHLFSGDVVRRDPTDKKADDTDFAPEPDGSRRPNKMMVYRGGVVYAPNKDWADAVISEVADFPYSAHDDYCFVAGTKIATRRGNVPIEEVTTGDEALTPFGWRRVTASGMTGVRPTMTALGLVGTGNHPVFSLDTGWQALDTVTHAFTPSRLSLCGLIRLILLISSSSKVSLIDGWEALGDITSLSPRPTLGERARRAFMLQSGSQPMGSRFRRGLKSITATMTCLISTLTIWSAYRSRSIVRCRGHSALLSRLIWMKSGLSHLLGTSQTRAESGTGTSHLNLSTKPGQRRPQPLPGQAASVAGAAPGSLSKTAARSTADQCASFSTAAIDGENTNSSTLTMRPVYNLTVAEVSCYYANGILVHNCDTVSQALGWCRKHGVVLRKVEYSEEEYERNKFRKPLGIPYAL